MSNAMAVQVWSEGNRYGRYEIKKYFHRNFVRGMVASFAIHAVVVSAYYIPQLIGGGEEDIPLVKVRMVKYSELGPPPSISRVAIPPPVGVQAIAKQQELSSTPSHALEELGGNNDVQITQDIQIDADPGMDEFIPYEKGPEIVKKVMPKYPDMALRAGLEGTVWVKILVDKDGKPKKAVVIKSTTEIFNDAAVEAAMQFIFTPAVMNNGAVRVWVALPFKFQLRDAQSS